MTSLSETARKSMTNEDQLMGYLFNVPFLSLLVLHHLRMICSRRFIPSLLFSCYDYN